MKRTHGWMLATAVMASLCGCEEERPRVYVVPKSDTAAELGAPSGAGEDAAPGRADGAAHASASAGSGNSGGTSGGASGGGGQSMFAMTSPTTLNWKVPAGWDRQPDSAMRYATFLIGPEGKRAELSISALPIGSRDLLSNIRRWRGQLGLPDVGDAEVLALASAAITIDGAETNLIDIAAPGQDEKPAQRMLAAIMARQREVWFFKLTGADEVVAPLKPTFEAFVKSVSFVDAGAGAPAGAQTPPMVVSRPEAPTGAGAGAAAAAPSSTASLPPGISAWRVPAAWQLDPKPSQFRVATFRAPGSAPGSAPGATGPEVVITRFSGSVGGMLDNINRWRGQVGLPPVKTIDEQKVVQLSNSTTPATLIDLEGPAGQPAGPQRLIVAMITQGDQLWFIKMTGAGDAVGGQKAAFEDFVRSLRLGAAGGRGG